jgi:tetratricopeptide (TPR) repeat protein
VANSATVAGSGTGVPDSALALLRVAQESDPLAPSLAENRLQAAVLVHDVAEARQAGDRALALTPANLSARLFRVMAELQDGRLDAARSILAATPAEVSRPSLAAYMATYQDLYWVLDDAQQRLLLGLSPAEFDDDRAAWALALAGTHAVRGDLPATRAFADTARRALEAQLRASPDDGQLRASLGLAFALRGAGGDSAAAVREGEHAAALAPLARDTWEGAYVRYQLARVYTLVGDRARAIAQLAALQRLPFVVTPGWLRIDPSFARLRGDPEFDRLARR